MNVITGKHLSRRTFLRGAGVSVALAIPGRHGARGAGLGGDRAGRDGFHPSRLRRGVDGSRGLERLGRLAAPLRSGRSRPRLRVRSRERAEAARSLPRVHDHRQQHGLPSGGAFRAEEIGGDHDRTTAVFLTQAHPKQTQGSDVDLGNLDRSDPRAALRAGHRSPLAGALHRGHRPRGRLRLQLPLRLHDVSRVGALRPARFRRFESRGSCSSASSARATLRKNGRRGARPNRSLLDWISTELSRLKRHALRRGPRGSGRVHRAHP